MAPAQNQGGSFCHLKNDGWPKHLRAYLTNSHHMGHNRHAFVFYKHVYIINMTGSSYILVHHKINYQGSGGVEKDEGFGSASRT